MKKRKKSNYSYAMAMPALIVYSIMFIIPMILCFVTAFTDWNVRNLTSFSFLGIDNFKKIFGDQYFLLAIKNTLIFAVVTTIFKVLFGLSLAMVLTKPLKSRNVLRSLFYMPAVLSTVVIGLVFTAFFEMGGMWDKFLGLFGYAGKLIWLGNEHTAIWCVIATEIWQWSGFSMMLFIAGLQGIPTDYYEAAQIDGASPIQRFWKITVPLLAPSFTITIITNLIGGLKVFDKVYVLTNGGPGYATQVLGTYVYKSFSAGFLGKSSAMSLVLTVIVCAITLLLNRQLKKREVEA
ncbi:sugar ABC transporter permease [Diplocloster hominis]|uniref:carbohydrate ABC transporter permease n=1 Tax=Diplocloster hominis TaxID=3079010 RepID=UPI0031BA1EF0